MIKKILFAALNLSFYPLSLANPGIEYDYDDNLNIKGINAIINIEEAMTQKGDNCLHGISDIIIDEIYYDKSSRQIEGFKGKKPNKNDKGTKFYFNGTDLYKITPQNKHRYINSFFQKNLNVMVTYQACGSGGFVNVRDIYKKSTLNRI